MGGLTSPIVVEQIKQAGTRYSALETSMKEPGISDIAFSTNSKYKVNNKTPEKVKIKGSKKNEELYSSV